ncbi:PIR Superfamily Protein [Plasmodium ovale curtisi]|uniref:PIR Superfamily Protein n=1 Tax=Plasmodium ovale curtisi TaxID=864141 RepID=A0A1A8WNX4_PLAOA|nr:PIR Superfamily Protein [Plasmodium ovale curtisi]
MHTYTKEILLLLYSIQDDNKLKGNFFKIYDCSLRKISDIFSEITCPSEETTKNLVQQACGNEDPRLPLTVYVTPNVRSSQKIKCEETPSVHNHFRRKNTLPEHTNYEIVDKFLGDYSQYVNRNSWRVGIT